MNPEEYEVMYQVEDHHWWYLGMEHITCSLLDKAVGRGHQLRILDAGCGTGAVMNYLASYGHVTGFDFAAEALKFCRQRGHQELTQASVIDLPYADHTFDLIVSFDVICEIGVDEIVALREFARVLKPGGCLLLRLPAYDWLRGKHDVAVHIRHRFHRRELKAKLRWCGLTPERTSYANMFLFPIAVVKRFGERLFRSDQASSDLTLDPGPFNGALRTILSAEAPLIRSVGLPFGLTVVALARRDEAQ
jgi:SAM-dependent methyltransferase